MTSDMKKLEKGRAILSNERKSQPNFHGEVV